EGEQIGVITLIYNHEQRGLISLLTDIQHENAKIITSTVHIHLDATNCLEIDVVHGSATDISGFAEKMMIQTGVFQVRTFVIPTLSLGNSDQSANNTMSVGYDDMRPDSRNCQLKTQKS
ncbi:MAG TPA: hypothetical protein VIJ25_11180, partial [Methylococcales bacterium]